MSIFTTLKERFNAFNQETRQLLAGIVMAAIIIALAFVLLQNHLAQLERRKVAREQTLTELLSLRQRYQEAALGANRIKNRLSLVTSEDSPLTILERTGIVAKNGILTKPLPPLEKNGLIEESAEISLTGISLNELVNLLHRLEQDPKPVSIKRLVTRTRFNDPAKLDTTITLALYRTAAPQGR